MSGGRRHPRHTWQIVDRDPASGRTVYACLGCGQRKEKDEMRTSTAGHAEHARELERYATIRRHRCPHCARVWRAMGIAPDWSTRETVASPDTQAARAHMRECSAELEVRS